MLGSGASKPASSGTRASPNRSSYLVGVLSHEQQFGVERRHHDAGMNLRRGEVGEQPGEIDHDLGGRVIDDGEVAVGRLQIGG